MKKALFIFVLLINFNINALMLNLKNVDIKTLINTVSIAVDKNFMVDPRVKGRVNIISNREIDNDQLYQVFLTVLKSHGFIVIEGENISRIVPKNLTKSESAYVSKNATDAIVTQIINLENVQASQIVPIVRPLMSSYGLLSVYIPTNSLIVVDTGSNIARLERIIYKLDKPIDTDFEFIPLKNTPASQIAATIKPLFSKKGGILNITVDKHNNQLIVSGSKSKRLKVRLLVAELDKRKPDSGSTAIIYLKYANAKDILPVLQGINQHNAAINKDSKVIKSNIQADEATNTIIITGNSKTKNTIKEIIIKLDVRRAQILIEAVIAEVSTSDARELGIQWIAKGGAGLGLTNLDGALPSLISSIAGNSSGSSISKLGGISLKGGLNFISGAYNNNSKTGLGVLINALNSTGNTNILSTPSIITLDNHEAEIIVGQEVPFITNKQLNENGSNPFQNYERKDVGLKLKVKPQINDGSSIKLDISQEISNVLNSSNAADLITSKRTIKTSVIVEDGKLLVLGGLIDDTWRESTSKVPFLGDIPLLGRLFTTKTRVKGKSNLMIFIRPTIIKDQILSNEISMEKYSYIRAQQLLNDENAIIKDQNNFLIRRGNNRINKKDLSGYVAKHIKRTTGFINNNFDPNENYEFIGSRSEDIAKYVYKKPTTLKEPKVQKRTYTNISNSNSDDYQFVGSTVKFKTLNKDKKIDYAISDTVTYKDYQFVGSTIKFQALSSAEEKIDSQISDFVDYKKYEFIGKATAKKKYRIENNTNIENIALIREIKEVAVTNKNNILDGRYLNINLNEEDYILKPGGF